MDRKFDEADHKSETPRFHGALLAIGKNLLKDGYHPCRSDSMA